MAWKKILLEGDAAALSDTAPVNVDKSTASAGTGTTASRTDHKHDITTGTPVAIGSANSEGTATSLARSDHVHNHGTFASGDLHTVYVKKAGDTMSGNLNMGQNQLQEVVIHRATTAPNPAAEVEGQIYYNSSVGDKHLYIWVP